MFSDLHRKKMHVFFFFFFNTTIIYSLQVLITLNTRSDLSVVLTIRLMMQF